MTSDEGLLPGCFRLADLASWLIDPSRTMTTRRASVQTRYSSKSVRNTDDGEGLARTAGDESDHSSSCDVGQGQGTHHRDDDAVFSEHDDDFSLVGESNVDSLVLLQRSSAACTRSEDLSPPAGVGQTAPNSFGAGAQLQPAGSVSLGAQTVTAVASLPTGPQPSIHHPRSSRSIRPPGCTSVGQSTVLASSAQLRAEASDAAAAATLVSQMDLQFGACCHALFRAEQRETVSRMEAMAGVSLSIASASVEVEALLPTTARPTTFVPLQEAPDSVPLSAAETPASFGVVVLSEVLPCHTGADLVPAPAVSASSMDCASSVGTRVASPPDDGGSQICAEPPTLFESDPVLHYGCGDACFALVRDCALQRAPIEPLPGTQPLRLSPPSSEEAHFDSSTAFAIEASAVCKSHEFGAVVLASLAAPLTVRPSKVLAVNSVSFLADALQTLLLVAIYSALASSARVAFVAVSGSEAVEYIDPGYDPPVLVCC